MKKHLLSTFIFGATFSMFAAPINPEEALSRAIQGSGRFALKGLSHYELIKTERHNGKDALYIFGKTEGSGFILAPADDNCPSLLGYGDTNIYDENGEMAPGFAYWIGELGRQVEYSSSLQQTPNSFKISRPERDPIPELCSTLWNQTAPYNNNCPVVNKQTCVTGCVATAMAQVMKYHNWPETGQGIVSYRGPGGKNLKMNLGHTIFQWEDMLDSYDDSSSEEACEAVATLMQAAGYSVEMDYSPNGSGAASINIAPALGNYFKYDRSLKYLLRDYYTLSEWEDMIYNSLKNCGPVIYNGQAGIGGHSFVCDGYSADGYFHFNWGWGGLSDGYFLLDALDPIHQGIGGADGGFDYLQDIIIDIRPDKTGDSTWSFQMYAHNYPEYSIDEDEYGPFLLIDTSFYNYGPGSIINSYVGFTFKNIDNPKEEPLYAVYSTETIMPLYGYASFGAYIPYLEDGRYEVGLVYGSGGEEPVAVKFPVFAQGNTILTAKGGNYTIETEIIEEPEFLDTVYPDKVNTATGIVNIRGTLSNPNTTPYLCFLGAVVLDDNLSGVITYSIPTPIDLDGSEVIDINFNTSLSSPSRISEGYHNLAFGQINSYIGNIVLLTAPESVYFGDLSGIESMFGDETGRLEFFTLDGIKVAETDNNSRPELPSGLYIVRTSKGSSKVYLK